MALVKCPDCGREVSDVAPSCPGCGHPIAQPGAAAAPAKRRTSAGTLGCAFILLLVLGWCVNIMLRAPVGGPPAPGIATVAPAAAAPLLELQSWHWAQSEGGSHAIVEGLVKNVSNRPLKSIQAFVTFATATGQQITSEGSLLDYNPILPGQTSPFKVYATWNPAMKKASIDFKELFGPSVPWRQAATPPPKK